MKSSDFKQVKELITQLEHINSVLNGEESSDHEWLKNSCCYLSQFLDGEGAYLDLTQCGIAKELFECALLLLQQKAEEIRGELTNLGVELD